MSLKIQITSGLEITGKLIEKAIDADDNYPHQSAFEEETTPEETTTSEEETSPEETTVSEEEVSVF